MDIFLYVLFSIGTFLAAVALIGSGGFTHNLTILRGESFLTLFPYCMMGLAAVTVITSGRDMAQILSASVFIEARHPASIWITRLTSVALVLASLHLIAIRFQGANSLRTRLPLASAFVLLWLTTVLLPAIAGYRPELSHEYFYCLIIGSALTLLPLSTGRRLVADTRDAIVFFIFFALLFIPLIPSMVLDLGYVRGLIPGLPRFAGFAPHPVAMGLIGIVGLLCWLSKKYEHRWQNVLAGVILIIGIFLAQSKTSWMAAVFSVVILKAFSTHRSMFIQPLKEPHRKIWIGILAVMMALALAVLVLTVSDILPSAFESFTNSAKGTELMSLTGRGQIWAVALEEWQSYPVFGYGPSLFDEAYRISVGMSYAMHGHNELIDTLARSGSIGGAGVVVYYIILTFYAIKTAVTTNGLSVALWILVTLQCISEVPLQLFRYGPENLPHFILLGVVASHIAQSRSDSQRSRLATEHSPECSVMKSI